MTDDVQKHILSRADKPGWSVVGVAPETGDPVPMQCFAYTVGLTRTYGWPEFIAIGDLDVDKLRRVVTRALEECIKKKLQPAAGMKLAAVAAPFAAKFADASAVHDYYFNYAIWYANHSGGDARVKRLQVLYPDKDGHLPDDPNCIPEVAAMQVSVLQAPPPGSWR